MTLIVSMVAAGLAPMLISSAIVDRQARGKLEQATYERLQADVSNRKGHLEDYVQVVKRQNALMAGGRVVQDAMSKFANAFKNVNTDFEMRGEPLPIDASLQAFYEGQFMPKYQNESDGTASVDQLIPNTIQGKYLQYLYMAKNPHPLGQKDQLIKSTQFSEYDFQHENFHPIFISFLHVFELYDIFLIEPEQGNVVYSVYKEIDYATSLFNGPHRDSGLADVARKALNAPDGTVVMEDFSPYLPSYDAPASFVGAPIHEDGKLLGALVFQMPTDQINAMMGAYDGLGESGEAILVGDDSQRRAKSRFSEDSTKSSQRIESDLVDKALTGDSGAERELVAGIEYIAAYAPVNVDGVRWVMITRMRADEALSAVKELTLTAAMVALVGALAVIVFAWWLGRHLYGTLGADPSELLQLAQRIGEGDLTATGSEVGSVGAYAAMIHMRARLREVLCEAYRVSVEVKAGVSEISEGNRGLSERTEQQASNLEQTAASTEELTSTVKHNAMNAQSANTLVISTRACALESGIVAERAGRAMQDISQSSEQIAAIIGVIDDIAFQTNLLALNAAVEAARAGEQGQGFAVVASEVRQLAGRSASAAKEIKELIEDSVSKVQDGTILVQKSGAALENIVASVGSLTDLIGQITLASDKQTTGIEQINQALVHLDNTTQQNTSMVEGAAMTSDAISRQADQLSKHIGYFRIAA